MGQTQHMFDCCCSCMEVLNYSSGHIFMVHMHVWCIIRLYISRDSAVLYANFTTLMWYCGLLEMWTNCDCLRRFLPGASKGTPGDAKCVKDFLDAFASPGVPRGTKKWNLGRTKFSWRFFLKCAVTYTSIFNSKIFPGVILPDPFKRDRRVGRGRERRGCIVAVRGGRPWNRLAF